MRLMPFNKDILLAWSVVSSNPETQDTENLMKVSLWQNSEIVDAKGIGLLSKRLNNVGIKTVGQIIQNDESLIPISKLHEYGLSKNLYLEWISVCKSIPAHWIVKLKESLKDCGTPEDHRVFEETPDLYFQKEKYKIEKCTQKIVLNIIRNKRIKPVNKYKSKMSDKYKINDKQWKQKYTFISQWSISTKNRSFMWRFLYGIVYTNEDFFKFGFKE